MAEGKSSFPLLATRGAEGLEFVEINNDKFIASQHKVSDKVCRIMKFSDSGAKFAWCDGILLQVMNTATKEVLFTKELIRTYAMTFSPDESILVTWEPYLVTKDFPQGKANLHLWNLSSGDLVFEAVQKKVNGWEPIWMKHSNICAKQMGSAVNFYKGNDFSQPASKLRIDKLDSFALSPNAKPPTRVACFVRGAKSGPSAVRLFKYPRFSHSDVIANKSFFKADSASMLWSDQGTSLLVKTAVEVDTTGESYYGEQNLHFMSTTGDTAIVALSKKGPIYDVAWAPNANEFCVVFGFMPAKACIFNLKCDPIFEFSPTPKNLCFFNPHGNILVLAGFGNLRGNMEVWDFEKRMQLAQFYSPDTTHFQWCADGEHFMTATTAPRLRVGNGYKLWHYKNGMFLEKKAEGQVHQVEWQSKPEEMYPAPVIGKVSKKQVEASISAAKPASYVPPHARGNPNYVSKIRSLNADEEPTAVRKPSKSAEKKLRKREKEAAARQAKNAPSFTLPSPGSSEQQDAVAMAKYLLGNSPPSNITADSNADVPAPSQAAVPNDDKRIKFLRKKLTAIEKLKQELSGGKVLNSQQIEKLKAESNVREELERLKLSSS